MTAPRATRPPPRYSTSAQASAWDTLTAIRVKLIRSKRWRPMRAAPKVSPGTEMARSMASTMTSNCAADRTGGATSKMVGNTPAMARPMPRATSPGRQSRYSDVVSVPATRSGRPLAS